jgi:hypothetical protein
MDRDNVELLVIVDGQARGVALPPIDHGRRGPRDREHAGVRIDADDAGAFAEPFFRYARDDPRAAGDIEQAIAAGEIRAAQQLFGEGAEQRPDQESLIELGQAR